LKVIGICLVTEFTANVCRDSGSSSLAGTVTLTGKILVTIAALPMYSDILNVVLELIKR
jgi:stage III sporulation protein AD